ncbi:hypothetical protein BKA81DRAFT_380491 [Phyllosticta paracitricarpa]|uniref:Uncharacterized protein n=1 Tax=Phyllosticta citricarpa TaxID=55181 RepID=A0ABR1LRX6_9PEZI
MPWSRGCWSVSCPSAFVPCCRAKTSKLTSRRARSTPRRSSSMNAMPDVIGCADFPTHGNPDEWPLCNASSQLSWAPDIHPIAAAATTLEDKARQLRCALLSATDHDATSVLDAPRFETSRASGPRHGASAAMSRWKIDSGASGVCLAFHRILLPALQMMRRVDMQVSISTGRCSVCGEDAVFAKGEAVEPVEQSSSRAVEPPYPGFCPSLSASTGPRRPSPLTTTPPHNTSHSIAAAIDNSSRHLVLVD